MKLRWSFIILSLLSLESLTSASLAKESSDQSQKPHHKKDEFDPVVRFGNPDTAHLKIVMYHSLNCNHCKDYLNSIFPKIEEQYIKTGKVYFEIRDYPIDQTALDAARLAWCRNDPKVYWQVAKILHDQLDENEDKPNWSLSPKANEEIIKILEDHGFTADECTDCLKNETLKDKIIQDCYKIQKQYKLTYTPAFIVDGKLVGTMLDIPELEKLLQKKLHSPNND